MSKTKIEWADEVWNPTVGCTPVSAGCAHCYAKRMFERGMVRLTVLKEGAAKSVYEDRGIRRL